MLLTLIQLKATQLTFIQLSAAHAHPAQSCSAHAQPAELKLIPLSSGSAPLTSSSSWLSAAHAQLILAQPSSRSAHRAQLRSIHRVSIFKIDSGGGRGEVKGVEQGVREGESGVSCQIDLKKELVTQGF